jgi:Flp pilus assembly pilin Flp
VNHLPHQNRPESTHAGPIDGQPSSSHGPLHADEDGSLVTEYGLIAIVGATVASIVLKWASNGSIWNLFDAVTVKVRALLGA